MRPDRTKPSLFTTGQLIEHLNKKYPDKCIRHNESVETAHRKAGNREVVDYMLWVQSLNDDELPTIFEPDEEQF